MNNFSAYSLKLTDNRLKINEIFDKFSLCECIHVDGCYFGGHCYFGLSTVNKSTIVSAC